MAKKMLCTLKKNRPNKGSEPEFFPLLGGIGSVTLVPGKPTVVGGGALEYLQKNFSDIITFDPIPEPNMKAKEEAKPKDKKSDTKEKKDLSSLNKKSSK